MAKKKEKKEKVIYYDDNSTIVDMSDVGGVGRKPRSQQPQKPPSTAGEKWKTYWSAVKMMVMPMCVVLGILCVLFFFPMLLSGGFGN